MRNNEKLASRWMFVGVCAVVLGWLLILPAGILAQTAGNNDVYYSQGNQKASSAFIDAYAVSLTLSGGTDLCDTIYRGILQPAGYSAAVIDARGISGTALTCTHGSPWNESGVYLNKPSTILLPAGTILIPSTWTLTGPRS